MKSVIVSIILSIIIASTVSAQEKQIIEVKMTLDEVIEMAQRQSLHSFRSKNMYLARYWEFRSYRADKLPSLMLNTTPVNYDRSVVNRYDDGVERFMPRSYLTSDAELSIRQNVTLTGGTFDVKTSMARIQNLDNDDVDYSAVPVSIGFTQSLNGYNRFRWESRIEPLKFEQAKLSYLQSLEGLSIQSTHYFFNTITAEINQRIAEVNYSNADTLYNIGKGRFEIGTVTQDELLDLELSLLNARLAVSRSEINMKQAHAALNSFLGLDDEIRIICEVPATIPKLEVNVEKALALSLENNPDVLDYQRQLLVARQNVARTRSESGLSANIRANLGINKSAPEIEELYQSPFLEQQQIRVGLNVPIIDWGRRKGQIQMARSNQEVTEASVKQSLQDFEQEAIISVLDFNLQEEQVAIAAKADTIAQLGYEVTKQRFMIDKVDVIRLNSAQNSLDAARRSYIDALRKFWVSYYEIRQLTLYDFEKEISLIENLDDLLQK